MPIDASPLFRPDVLRRRLIAFSVPKSADNEREKIKRWAEILTTPRGLAYKEREIWPEYVNDVFLGVLGYTGPTSEPGYRYTLSREKLVEVDGKWYGRSEPFSVGMPVACPCSCYGFSFSQVT